MKKISITIGVLACIAFVYFGKSIYKPIINKVNKKETVTSRIENTKKDVWSRLEQNLGLAGYKMEYPSKIILVAFKEERTLQVYAKGNNGIKFIKEYPFTAYSGKLGPKLKEGDRQIPEGIYKVEYLNPNSSYYLSIKVDYPNAFDTSKTKLSNVADMGGDIFIHGKSVTIGCIPIGDQAIEEVFTLTENARNNPVKVIISPRDFRVNANYPEIDGIDWENQLYDIIYKELETLPKT